MLDFSSLSRTSGRPHHAVFGMLPGQLNSQDSRSRLILALEITQRELATIMAMVDHSAVLASAADGQQVSCRRQQTRRNRDRENVEARPEPLIDFGSRVADVREEDPGPLHVLKIKREIGSRDRLKDLLGDTDRDRLIATEIGA